MKKSPAALRREDERFMRRALDLARQGEGLTRPNPPVGAVVVRAGRIVGEGWHRRAGAPHAEAAALSAAGPAARGATLYVTLEPCSTWGRTPPCTDAIRASGVARVVVSCQDPNPRHAGRGLRLLRRAGLRVAVGVLRDEGERLIAPFRRWITTGRPYLTLKLAITLDGRMADRRGASRWISSAEARAEVQRLRSTADAVLVGLGTIRADDPSLRCRDWPRPDLYRVIVDSRCRVSPRARVVSDADRSRTIVATTARSPLARRAALARRGVTVWVLPANRGRVRLTSLLKALGRLGLLHVLCEGGATLAEALLKEGLVDACVFFIAPRLLGGSKSVPAVAGEGWLLDRAPRLRFADCRRVGCDLMVTAVPES